MSAIVCHYPNISKLCHTLSVYFHMSKKTERITFRTTEENNKHLEDIQAKYDLPIGDIVHRMIRYFAKSKNAKKTFEELHK